MLPEDINDLIIAAVALLVLSSVLFAVGRGIDNGTKISAEVYNSNFEEKMFLLNYLRTPVEKEGAMFTLADIILMCNVEDNFDYLKDKTDNILEEYGKNADILILCNGEEKNLCGQIGEIRTSIRLNEGYGIDIKLYEPSRSYSSYGPQQGSGCI